MNGHQKFQRLGDAFDGQRNQQPFEANERRNRRLVAAAGNRRQEIRLGAVDLHDQHDSHEATPAMEATATVGYQRSQPQGCKRPISLSPGYRCTRKRTHRTLGHSPARSSSDFERYGGGSIPSQVTGKITGTKKA